jgi:DNA modification methylase
MKKFQLLCGKSQDVLKSFKDNTFQAVVTSPPYWQLRDYFAEGQLGQEKTPEEYIENLVNIFREVKRVLRKDGVVWLNIGDSYNNSSGFCRAKEEWQREGRKGGSSDKKAFKHNVIKKKDLVGMPWSVAFALRADGWYLRCDVCWQKENPMPDGAKDRPTRGHEYIFMLTKSAKYYYDYYATLEDTKGKPISSQRFGSRHQKGTFRQDQERVFEHYGKRNIRSVWTTAVSRFRGGHFATFPPELIEKPILGSASEKGCCPKCYAPWRRLTEKKTVDGQLELLSTGWEPTCSCGVKKTERCLVLDPFNGVATTGVVSLKHNHYYVGVDVSEEYLQISRERFISEDDIFKDSNNNIDEVDFREIR